MRSRSWIISILLVVLSLGAIGPLGTRAQESTPAAGSASGPPAEEGVTFAPIGFAEGVSLPSPADLIAVRISIEPGAVSSLGANDPTSGLLVVESGTFTVRVDATWTVSRGAALQQAMANPPSDSEFDVSEAIAASEEATLAAGDVGYIPGNVKGELRNDGPEPAVGLLVVVAPGGTLSGSNAAAATPAS